MFPRPGEVQRGGALLGIRSALREARRSSIGLTRASDGHEAAVDGIEPALGVVAVTPQQHEVPREPAGFHVDQDQAAVAGLLNPRPGDGRDGAGRDDAVVGGVLRETVRAVGGDEGGMVSDPGKAVAGQLDQLRVEVDGKDLRVAEAVAEQGGV